MNGPQQPQHIPFQNIQSQQQPPQQIPTALTRFVGIVRALRGTAMTAAIILIAAELILPGPLKPSQVMGSFYGKVVAAESRTAQDTLAAQTRKGAEAQALPPVIAQRLDQSLQTQTGVANLADLGCIIGQFLPHNDPNSPDLSQVGEGLRTQACHLGTTLRTNMANELRQGTVQQIETEQPQ